MLYAIQLDIISKCHKHFPLHLHQLHMALQSLWYEGTQFRCLFGVARLVLELHLKQTYNNEAAEKTAHANTKY